ncbi:hypothetical protein CCACVL1_16454 [Corchorus capsularis]|uniref:TF-B3 domain-containing protein n=1 Tax=Corchorus capsularis TaxID=210143 RepID=A0A1R3HWS7_COCAP|nr:hypothetical protein CCACVL1_16454 [Corchorus capsularis]
MASFTKELSEVDAKKQMAIPTNFVEHLPSHGGGNTQYIPVVDVDGKVWRFGYYIRGENSPYPKPVFQGEWHQFAKAKKLVAGDQITFRIETDAAGNPRYTIAAQKPVSDKLFGHVIRGWGQEF